MNKIKDDTARNIMWERLLPELRHFDKSTRKPMKQNYAAKECKELHQITPSEDDYNKADLLVNCGASILKFTIPSTRNEVNFKQEEEKENTMGIEVNTIENERRYLRERLSRLYSDKSDRIYSKYTPHVSWPTKLDDLKKALKNGDITVDEKRFNHEGYYNGWTTPSATLVYNDPKKKQDPEGRELAMNKMFEQTNKVRDSIAVKTPVEALAELHAFEATEF